MKVKSLSHVRFVATSWTATYQAPPSMGFSRQEYWSGVPLPSPEPRSVWFQIVFLTCMLIYIILENALEILQNINIYNSLNINCILFITITYIVNSNEEAGSPLLSGTFSCSSSQKQMRLVFSEWALDTSFDSQSPCL